MRTPNVGAAGRVHPEGRGFRLLSPTPGRLDLGGSSRRAKGSGRPRAAAADRNSRDRFVASRANSRPGATRRRGRARPPGLPFDAPLPSRAARWDRLGGATTDEGGRSHPSARRRTAEGPQGPAAGRRSRLLRPSPPLPEGRSHRSGRPARGHDAAAPKGAPADLSEGRGGDGRESLAVSAGTAPTRPPGRLTAAGAGGKPGRERGAPPRVEHGASASRVRSMATPQANGPRADQRDRATVSATRAGIEGRGTARLGPQAEGSFRQPGRRSSSRPGGRTAGSSNNQAKSASSTSRRSSPG